MSWSRIDQQIGGLYTTYWDTVAKTAAGKQVLLVEGDDDKDVFEKLLSSVAPLWESNVHVAVAGSRDRVLRALKKPANAGWRGLVDRDTWDDAEVASRSVDRLTVTEGWCLESHFCDPGAVEDALNISPGVLTSALSEQLDPWLHYGAVRWTLQRARDAIFGSFPISRWGHPNKGARDDAALRSLLETVYKVAPDEVFAAIEARRRAVAAMPQRQQIETGIHGKELFCEAIVPVLNRVLTQKPPRVWRAEIAVAWKGRWPQYLTHLAETLLGQA